MGWLWVPSEQPGMEWPGPAGGGGGAALQWEKSKKAVKREKGLHVIPWC